MPENLLPPFKTRRSLQVFLTEQYVKPPRGFRTAHPWRLEDFPCSHRCCGLTIHWNMAGLGSQTGQISDWHGLRWSCARNMKTGILTTAILFSCIQNFPHDGPYSLVNNTNRANRRKIRTELFFLAIWQWQACGDNWKKVIGMKWELIDAFQWAGIRIYIL